jgi:hypothetical protein
MPSLFRRILLQLQLQKQLPVPVLKNTELATLDIRQRMTAEGLDPSDTDLA